MIGFIIAGIALLTLFTVRRTDCTGQARLHTQRASALVQRSLAHPSPARVWLRPQDTGWEVEALAGPATASRPEEICGNGQHRGALSPSEAIGAIGLCFLAPGLLAKPLRSFPWYRNPPRDCQHEAGDQGLAAQAGPSTAVSILIVPGFALPFASWRCFHKTPMEQPVASLELDLGSQPCPIA